MEENSISKNIGLGRLPVRIFAAAPPRGTEEHSTNNERCLVLTIQLVQGDRLPLVIELWGDADGEAVKRSLDAVRQEKGDVRIIKVPHHGSRDSNAPGLFDCDQPAVAVISVGPNNYGHPSEEILEAVCASKMPLYRTDRHGAVTVTCRGNKVTVVCFCAPCVE
jgi:competence protein ComEC